MAKEHDDAEGLLWRLGGCSRSSGWLATTCSWVPGNEVWVYTWSWGISKWWMYSRVKVCRWILNFARPRAVKSWVPVDFSQSHGRPPSTFQVKRFQGISHFRNMIISRTCALHRIFLGWLPQLSIITSMFKADTVNCGFDSPFVRHDYSLLKSIMGHYSVMCLQSVKTTFRTPMTPPLTPAVQAPVARQYETIRINSRWSFTSTMECSSKRIDCYNSVRFCCIIWRLPYVFLG